MTDYTEKPEISLDAPAAEEDALAEPIFAAVDDEPVDVSEEIVIAEDPVIEVIEQAVEAPVPADPKPAKKKHADPVPVTIEDIENLLPTPAGPAVVGNGERDVVKVSSIIYKNEVARKSLSVHHLQRRLFELGYDDAGKDKDGYFGPLTRRALVIFQEKNGLDPNGVPSIATLEKLFAGDPNVEIQP